MSSSGRDLEGARHFQEQLDEDEVFQMAVTKLVNTMAGTNDDLDVGVLESTWIALDEFETMCEQLDELRETVDDLEDENERLRKRLEDGGAGGKDQKVAAIVEYARNRRNGEDVVKLTAKEIKGATGCSRRYAYDLMDDENLPAEFDWILAKNDIKQYGDLEIKKEDGTRRIGIDFEGVHSAGCPLNKFTTTTAGEEGP